MEALASASGRSVDELAAEALNALAGSFKSRRAILQARRASAPGPAAPNLLADLGWLEGYSGQTVDELLLFDSTETPHNVLFALELAIQKKLETEGRLKMTGVERMLLSVSALAREVNNGGFDQFFRNSSRQFAPAIVNDLVRIGCIEIADIAQRALDALRLPSVTVAAIEAAMREDSQERDRALERCDLAFYAKSGLTGALFAYVKAHPDGIRI